jgi:hypothetical protein
VLEEAELAGDDARATSETHRRRPRAAGRRRDLRTPLVPNGGAPEDRLPTMSEHPTAYPPDLARHVYRELASIRQRDDLRAKFEGVWPDEPLLYGTTRGQK